jgi:hypothetical protein
MIGRSVALRLTTLGLAVALAAAWSPSPPDIGPDLGYVAPILELPLGRFQDCGYCGEGGCGFGYHWFVYEDGDGRDLGSESHNCSANYCSFVHPPHPNCDAEEQEQLEFVLLVEQAWRKGTDGAPSELTGLLAQFGERISYNPERRALQVLGCTGAVALSVPLTEAQAEGLAPS